MNIIDEYLKLLIIDKEIYDFFIANNYHMEVKDGKISDRLTEILKIIKKENPDVLGLQEVTEEVKSLIDQNYINYEVIGRSRYNNGQKRDF